MQKSAAGRFPAASHFGKKKLPLCGSLFSGSVFYFGTTPKVLMRKAIASTRTR